MKQFVKLNKLKLGDQVGIISPSSGLAGLFPWVQDLGLERMKDNFSLRPKEYPTTRKMNSSLSDRANDIMSAFADPWNKAIFASIGGSDQIELIKLLDEEVFLKNPKPFFGYSDNTHLHNFLWKLNIPSYYGGSIMTQFAMQGKMDDYTVNSLKVALFEKGTKQIIQSDEFTEIGLSWDDPDNLTKSRIYHKNNNWVWDGSSQEVAGILWGGCVESLIVQFTTGLYLPTDDELIGTVLFIETAEDIPEHWITEYLLIGMGERGWLDLFKAILVGRPKAWEFDKQYSLKKRLQYRTDQQQNIIKAVRKYNQDIPIIQNMDFGHTDPQVILPVGSMANIKPDDKAVFFDY